MKNLLLPKSLNVDLIFGQVLLSLNDSFCIGEMNQEGVMAFSVHPSFWEKLNYPVDERTANWFDCIESPTREAFLERCADFYTSDESAFTKHLPVKTHTNNTRWYIVQVVRLGISDINTQSFLFMLKDISIRIREKNLLDEGQKIMKIGFWEMDYLTKELFWSQITKEIHGVDSRFVPTIDTAFDFYKEGKSRENITKSFNKCVEEGTPFEIEAEIIRGDSQVIWIEARGKSEFEDGQCVRLYGTFQNITKRKNAENELRISEESFRGAFHNASIGMALISPKGQWLKINDSVCRITGYEREELLQLTFIDITHPEDLDLDLHLLNELIEGKRESYQMEKRYFHKDGHIVWIILSVSMVKDENNLPLYFISQITDITQRKIAYQQLKDANRRIQGIIDASTYVSIISTSLGGQILEFNKGAENLLGYKAEEVIHLKNLDFIHDPAEVEEKANKLSAEFGETIEGFDVFVYRARLGFHDSGDWTYIRKDGEKITVQLVVTAIRNSQNEIIGFLWMATDLTERKKAEKLMNKMAILESKSKEMEQFAYITSHDLREPLLTITNYISLIQNEFNDSLGDDAKKFFNFISEASLHLTQLINGLLEYSRLSNVPQKEKVDLTKVMDRVVAHLENTIHEQQAKIHYSNLGILKGYENHLYILFQNLIQNAIKFRHPSRTPDIQISCTKRDNFMIIAVKDNGIGIPERSQNKIFTIFQRLHDRKTYEGTGIGLALSSKICELHGGRIWVESKDGEGSTFFISALL